MDDGNPWALPQLATVMTAEIPRHAVNTAVTCHSKVKQCASVGFDYFERSCNIESAIKSERRGRSFGNGRNRIRQESIGTTVARVFSVFNDISLRTSGQTMGSLGKVADLKRATEEAVANS